MMRGAAEGEAELIKDLRFPLFLLFPLKEILKITKKGEFFFLEIIFLIMVFFKYLNLSLVFMVALKYVHMEHNSIKE